ncbi:hypothetical protein PIB30_039275 [Stylosanthes scabra]|uniref:Uncharacterized protein n=1 Tax=Stylosanthes scabra TaxID=79078 RepID=A0ABU6WCM9_9FABA|nr:hypothetical protein [Stylosanthes scabra]
MLIGDEVDHGLLSNSKFVLSWTNERQRQWLQAEQILNLILLVAIVEEWFCNEIPILHAALPKGELFWASFSLNDGVQVVVLHEERQVDQGFSLFSFLFGFEFNVRE